MSLGDAFTATVIIALVTFLTRVFPFIFFIKKDPPASVRYIERYIPPMVMLILVVYSVKDTDLLEYPFGIPQAVSVLAVAALHLWKRNALISIFGGTILYMVLVQAVF